MDNLGQPDKMNIKLSSRVQAVKPSPTLAITARAAELRAAGKDVIGLGAGEPDFDTPDHIKEAAKRAIDEGKTKYTAVDGTASLKQAVIDKFDRDNGLEYQPDQILVSSGGKQSYPPAENAHKCIIANLKFSRPITDLLSNTVHFHANSSTYL